MKLGISSHTYKWSFGIGGYPSPKIVFDEEKLILKAADLGVEMIQFGDNFPLHEKKDEDFSRLKALLDEKGIEVEIGTVGTSPKHLLRYLEIASQLGAYLVRTRIGSREKLEDMETARRNLEQVLGHYEKLGVLLVLENYEMYSVRLLADLVARMNHPYLAVCLDTGNSVAALESPDMVVDVLAPYARCLHIKDFIFKRQDHGLGYTVEGCPVGKGLLNVESIFNRLIPYGKLLSVVLEQWTPYRGSIAETLNIQDKWVAQSLDYLRRYIPQ